VTSIPIANLYYLLCYAWDALEQRDAVETGLSDCETYADLFGTVLHAGVSRLIKRGLDRDYVEYQEETSRPSGRMDLGISIKRNLLRRPAVHCSYDSLTQDVLHNQILRTTIRDLLGVPKLDDKLKRRLTRIHRRLGGIRHVRLSPRVFSQVALHRNNAQYRFLLNVCRLVHERTLVAEGSGDARFLDFDAESRRMWRLFEQFVRNFYRREQHAYRVGSRNIQWQARSTDDALAYLPIMQTDSSLEAVDGTRTIIVDTKYYPETLQPHRNKDSIHSAHLYQMFAYLENAAAASKSSTVHEGVLLYPEVDRPLDLSYSIHGRTLRVVTVDLAADWRQIHTRLLDIVGLAA
jgi:5-methylcytosine-specific restriction enzyme subunit McrC